jgi:hypothetical protein
MGISNLSGKDWWHANQASYPNSREVDDLEPGFRSRVQDFIASLRHAGAAVVVNSTRRNAIRAHLMHYSWRIAYGDVEPKDVPKRGGLNIEWDHGDLEKSREAAKEMVNLLSRLRSHVSAGCNIRRQDPQGCQARRPPYRAAHEVRTRHQPQDRQGPWAHHPAVAAAAGGSGDRVMDRSGGW